VEQRRRTSPVINLSSSTQDQDEKGSVTAVAVQVMLAWMMAPGEGGGADADDWRTLNRANWDDRVPIHLASQLYDLEGFRKTRDSLRPFEDAEVGDVRGKDLMHLQCHVGLDTLSWAGRGARVWGLDFSPPAIEAARGLAAALGLSASFVVSDIYDAAAAFGGQRFDIVYTGIGALCWLPDVSRWARLVAELLRPGGFLYLVEGHPFAGVLDDQTGLVISHDYFDDAPRRESHPYTYTDGDAVLAHPVHVEFPHTLGEILTALAQAGLRLEFLHEHDFELSERFGSLQRQQDGTWRFPPGRPRVPMLYSLRAARG
jgi:SAM-dependent methyltransferase